MTIAECAWNYKNTTHFQLINECLRNLISCRTNMYSIIRCTVFVALSAISAYNLDASIFKWRLITLEYIVVAEFSEYIDMFNPNNTSLAILLGHFVKRGT